MYIRRKVRIFARKPMKKFFTAALAAIVSGMLCLVSFAADTDIKLNPVGVETALEIAVEYADENNAGSAKQDQENASLYSLLLGEGTEQSPYEIYNEFDLFFFADSINSGEDTKAYYKLMDDIDLGGQNWAPIGYYTESLEYAACFSGVFDGNGHIISNFTISSNAQYVGFFGFIYNGTVKNLTLSDFEVDVTSDYLSLYAGGLAGRCISSGSGNRIALENCTVKNASVKADGKGSVYAGGIAGYFMSSDSSDDSYIKNCNAFVPVVAQSSSDKTASASHEAYAGGLVGYLGATVDTKISVSQSLSTEDIKAVTIPDSNYEIGAFAGGLTGFTGASGETSTLSISQCYSLGNVYIECTYEGYVGGFSGYFSTTSGAIEVRDCYSNGNACGITYSEASGMDYVCVGSFAGAMTPGVTVESSFTSGDAEDLGSPDSYAGVFSGYNFGAAIENCYYPDTVVIDGVVENTQDAKAITAENINNPDSYVGFDFENVWKFFEDGYKYPVFAGNTHLLRVTFVSADKEYDTYLSEYAAALVLPDTTPKDYADDGYDYSFLHWSLAEKGEDVSLQQVFVVDNITVYAVFESVAKMFEVVFVNEGEVFHTESLAYGSSISAPANVPTKAADVNFWYKFLRWSLSEDGTDKTDIETLKVTKKLVLYAIFEGLDHDVWDGKTGSKFISGKGTKSSPYKISNGYQLFYLSQNVANGSSEYTSAYYELTADINLGGNEWAPIGTAENPFTGTFDGNGYRIMNFVISSPYRFAGLFGYAENADIGRFAIENAAITVDDLDAEIKAGFAVGNAVEGCSIHEISVSDSSMEIVSNKSVYAGGIVGHMASSDGENIVSDCYVCANIDVVSNDVNVYAGYIAGELNSKGNGFSGISNCYALGSLSAEAFKYAYAGGIAGYIESAGNGNNAWYGSVEFTSELSGQDDVVIYGCFAVGSVKVSAEAFAYAGYILGDASEYAKTADCYYYEEMSIEAFAQDDTAYINEMGTSSTIDNFKDSDFLIDNLGFDFVTIWMMSTDNVYMYPVLKILTLDKPIFAVKNINSLAQSVSLDVKVMAIDSKAYNVVLSVYSDRGRLIGIKTVKIEDNASPTAHEFTMVIDNVKDAHYIKVTVVDNQSRQLLFPTVYKSVA